MRNARRRAIVFEPENDVREGEQAGRDDDDDARLGRIAQVKGHAADDRAAQHEEVKQHQHALCAAQSDLAHHHQREHDQRQDGQRKQEIGRLRDGSVVVQEDEINYVPGKEVGGADDGKEVFVIAAVGEERVETQQYVAYRAEHQRAQNEDAVIETLLVEQECDHTACQKEQAREQFEHELAVFVVVHVAICFDAGAHHAQNSYRNEVTHNSIILYQTRKVNKNNAQCEMHNA